MQTRIAATSDIRATGLLRLPVAFLHRRSFFQNRPCWTVLKECYRPRATQSPSEGIQEERHLCSMRSIVEDCRYLPNMRVNGPTRDRRENF